MLLGKWKVLMQYLCILKHPPPKKKKHQKGGGGGELNRLQYYGTLLNSGYDLAYGLTVWSKTVVSTLDCISLSTPMYVDL